MNTAQQKGHLLTVEDNPVNRKLPARRMQDLGQQVETAENESEALEKLRAEA